MHQEHLEQKVHFLYDNYTFNLQKRLQKVEQLASSAIFFKLSCLLIGSKAQQTSHVSNTEVTYDNLPKHLNSTIKKLFYCIPKGAKNGANAKIAKISHFF